MYIKQVIIEGFKSYKDQTIAEPFSPKINVVVGANGSGKSNFFHAIRFVLNDAFASLRAEERQALLHEGAGHAVMSAYVEVVFDNSDGRFPVDKDEIRLRRTIGLKKDEFTLDRKHINKTEVMNLLESAGFSRANPYYVVQQGKIMAMSTMKDAERLELLKEIGGTRVYEDKRKESLKVMVDAEAKKAEIAECVSFIEAKMSELEKDRAELVEFQGLDKTRRSIEYALRDRELTEARAQLSKVDEERAKLSSGTSEAQEEAAAAAVRLQELAARAAALETSSAAAGKQRASLLKEREAALKRKTQLELDVKEVKEKMEAEASLSSAAREELAALEAEVAAASKAQAAAARKLAQVTTQQEELSGRLEDARQQKQTLMHKQVRASHFSSQAERDAHLQREAATLEATAAGRAATQAKLQQQIQALGEELNELASGTRDAEGRVRKAEEAVAAVTAHAGELRRLMDEAHEARRDKSAARDELEGQLRELKERHKQALQDAAKAAPYDISSGLRALEGIAARGGITGLYDALVNLITVPPPLVVATEVVGQNRLYEVVVKDQATGLQLVNALNRERAGRITFMPLDRLQAPDVSYPREFGQDAVPLYKHLKFDAKFEAAVKQVWGRTMVCKDRSIAERVAAGGRLDAITLEGDLVRSKGTVSGGYQDTSRSKILSHHKLREFEKELKVLGEQDKVLREKEAEWDQRVTQLKGELLALDVERRHRDKQLAAAQEAVRGVKREEERKRQELARVEETLQVEAAAAADVARQLKGLREELATDMREGLSPQEQQQLEQLMGVVADMEKELKALKTAKSKAKTLKDRYDQELNINLLKRKEELQQQADQGGQALVERTQLSSAEEELARVEGEVAGLAARVEEVAKKLEAVKKESRELASERDRLQEVVEAGAGAAAQEARRLEGLATRRQQLTARCEDLGRKIRELGSLPADAFEKYRDKGVQELHRLLKRTQESLSGFSHVNRKALDQYTNFQEQREDLARRRQEVATSESKIRELISSLDLRKDEAIERTFKGVAKNFREVFAALVPGGRGELVMQRRHHGDEEEEEAGEQEQQQQQEEDRGVLEKYSGVKVRVAFTHGSETMSLKQLSGGQKTLVALALIFAIQRCDPAPFYLFDEIDAALDPQYRTTVAKLLRQQANDERNPAMFIITTFHPQIIHEADKVYGVSHSNRISQVDVITKADALAFLSTEEEQQQQEEEQQQGAAKGGKAAKAAVAAGGAGGKEAAAAVAGDEDAAEKPRAGKRSRR